MSAPSASPGSTCPAPRFGATTFPMSSPASAAARPSTRRGARNGYGPAAQHPPRGGGPQRDASVTTVVCVAVRQTLDCVGGHAWRRHSSPWAPAAQPLYRLAVCLGARSSPAPGGRPLCGVGVCVCVCVREEAEIKKFLAVWHTTDLPEQSRSRGALPSAS